MTFLEIVQRFCGVRGLPVPALVIGTSDPQILQIQGLVTNWLLDLVTRMAWQVNILQATHITLAQEDQGSIRAIAPFGFVAILPETMFDRTQRLPIFGGTSPAEWQARKAFNITGPYYQFRLRGDRLLFTPQSPAGHELVFEYQSDWFVRDALGAAKELWTLDADTPALDWKLVFAWLQWAWPAAKNLEYAEQFNAYERLLATYMGSDNAPQKVNMGDTMKNLRPGILVPEGSWSLGSP